MEMRERYSAQLRTERPYSWEREAPGVAERAELDERWIVERDLIHQQWADRCWTVGEIGELTAEEGIGG